MIGLCCWIAVSSVPGRGQSTALGVGGASEDIPDEAVGDQRSPGQVQVLVIRYIFAVNVVMCGCLILFRFIWLCLIGFVNGLLGIS